MLDLIKSIRIVVYLYDIVAVDTIDAAVGSASDLFASLNGYLAVRLFNCHHLRESGHLKDLINIRFYIDDSEIRMILSETEYDS